MLKAVCWRTVLCAVVWIEKACFYGSRTYANGSTNKPATTPIRTVGIGIFNRAPLLLWR